MLAFKTQAQQMPPQVKLDSKMKSEAVTNLSKTLIENYIFLDSAKKVEALLNANLKNGVYDNIEDPMQFAQQITKDIQSITHDKHLRFGFNPGMAADLLKGGDDDENNPILQKKYEEEMRQGNFGFKKVEILNGNIGYLDLRGFNDARIATETGAAAMNFLSNANAVIIDLRENGGGDPNMVKFLCSYLFDSKVHLNDLYYRKKNETEEFWTLETVPGKKLTNMDVYVLTSHFTFSGAEEFTYNLKNLKRATIIGENTGGGANPGGPVRISENFICFVPTGRAINPITKTNWEGTGIAPDIECKKEDALTIAQIEIFKNLISKSNSEEQKQQYKWNIEPLEAKLNPVTVSSEVLQKYAGDYGPRKIYFENNQLIYERPGVLGKTKLTPIRADYFTLEARDNFRVKFNTDASGNVISLTGMYSDGVQEENKKEK
ncbi:MAG: S41 family peptidase [Bacteroidetes bacterium]|nr:S41 family peptidase [Bacteroidota bacterium]